MPESFSSDRIDQLKARLDRDPTSRVFLQLAEEYRRGGSLPEAIGILRAGLEAHPSYIAARVVLGRSLLEAGQPGAAVRELERAVDLDPTQLVANRLLVEAHLAEGRPEKARERLELYRLLNDRDDEIVRLDERILELGGPPAALPARHRFEAAEPTAAVEPDSVAEEIDPEAPPSTTEMAAPARGRGRSEQPFGPIRFPGAGARIVTALAAEGVFVVRAAVAEELRPVAADPSVEQRTPEPIRVEAPPVFTFGEAEVETATPAGAVAAPEAPALEPVFEIADESGTETEPVEAAITPSVSPAGDEPEPREAPATEPEATAESGEATRSTTTLGELYLAQGHLADAEESFAAVLQTRPDDRAALLGLEEVRRRRREAEEAFLDQDEPDREEVAAPGTALAGGGLTSRKILLLRDFLNRMRRGSGPHVS